MYLYKITLTNGNIFIIKSKEMINALLEKIEFYEWKDYLLAERTTMYVGDKAIKNNIVMIKSDTISSIEYYAGNPTL